MKILSWNVAGLRALIKNNNINNLLNLNKIDIICFQETKCKENEINLPEFINNIFKFQFWNSTSSKLQRKGLSGTCILSKIKPINSFRPDFDDEGRICINEFEKFILINIYVPNSQKFESERYYFRDNWDLLFNKLINELLKKKNKSLIICGDFNIAQTDLDINNPKPKKNKIAGFYDFEINNFNLLLSQNNLVDIYRYFYPNQKISTYWSNFLKQPRSNLNGWRIDYFISSKEFIKNIKKIEILEEIKDSDHCPLILEIS